MQESVIQPATEPETCGGPWLLAVTWTMNSSVPGDAPRYTGVIEFAQAQTAVGVIVSLAGFLAICAAAWRRFRHRRHA